MFGLIINPGTNRAPEVLSGRAIDIVNQCLDHIAMLFLFDLITEYVLKTYKLTYHLVNSYIKVYRTRLRLFCMLICSFFLSFSQQMLLTPFLPRPNNRQGRQSICPHAADILFWKTGKPAHFTSHNHPMTQILLLAQFTEGKIQASSKSKHQDSAPGQSEDRL